MTADTDESTKKHKLKCIILFTMYLSANISRRSKERKYVMISNTY